MDKKASKTIFLLPVLAMVHGCMNAKGPMIQNKVNLCRRELMVMANLLDVQLSKDWNKVMTVQEFQASSEFMNAGKQCPGLMAIQGKRQPVASWIFKLSEEKTCQMLIGPGDGRFDFDDCPGSLNPPAGTPPPAN